MIRTYHCSGLRLRPGETPPTDLRQPVWIDLEAPSAAEEARIEAALGIEVPTREDMQEIEPSSRIWKEEGILYLTAQILATPDPKSLEIGPVTFMLQPERLITVHYHRPGSFAFFADWAGHHDTPCSTGVTAFLGLMEAVVDRLADILESEARSHEQLTRSIFESRQGSGDDLSGVIRLIGRAEDRNGKINESLATVQRILAYLVTPGASAAKALLQGQQRDQLKSLIQDLRSLREVARVQSEKIRFQLDATLGVINIRQADIIKIFSVVAFVFLPPTLIASIYGMNFEHMPELSWRWGYPAALGLMLTSAIVPWALFRWKKWL
ncbi:magnesium transporter CorA family protein [Pseudogemmobacter faecipullorum]|uniref:Magnesium transporter CorA family protein n=1 Tax=Pseudogemmobacter faecipullorum TaxID=2755041 RepID=A0ABS8CGY8_9RHOB|nr:magnesium transporter CorA family protein [Pseudogemmobacter faecipullorum]MCB5408478.1 magnesium transporter CorA family protein [Pseudogemmobacter faecipullorum]